MHKLTEPSKDGKMGLFSAVALIVSACIGSAIFSISGLTVYYAGASAVISWILAAAVYGIYGVVLSRLIALYPLSGGIFVFPKRAFGGKTGSLLGFVSGWGYIISNMIAISFSAIYAGIFLHAGFPSLPSGTLIPLCTLTAALAITLPGRNSSATVQNALAVLLLGTLLAYCGTALCGGNFDSSGFDSFFTSGAKGSTGFLSSVPLAMVAYGGCVTIAFLASEVKNPKKNVPKSLLIGLGIVALVYAAVIASIVGTLPKNILDNDESLRYTPLFASITAGYLSEFPWLLKLISISGTIALLTTVTALLRINSRAVQAISADGLLPAFLFRENRNGTAANALITMTVICAVLATRADWTETMISLGAVLNVVSMSVTCIALIAARKDSRLLPLAVIAVFLLCCIPDIAGGGGRIWIFTAVVYALGGIVYLVASRTGNPRLSGVVVHGKNRGHLHGMPTANIEPFEGEIWPEYGVWATMVHLDGKSYRSVTHVGLRPSDDKSPVPTIESLILDFDEDIYGRPLTLEFVKFIRKTEKFGNLDELRQRIDRDIASSWGEFKK